MEFIDVRLLKAGPSVFEEKDLEKLKKKGATRNWEKSPFPTNNNINNRVVLFDGSIDLLKADVIVNPSNENLTHLDYVNKLAGPELERHIKKKVGYCSTGDVRLTPGFQSNFKHIIHAVPPKYQSKYKTAAETALYHTYFRVLELMIENNFKTVVMPTLATPKCNLPIEDNCHMQLRIIRRMLEKKLNDFDRIVVHVKDVERYEKNFFCYFPRSALDEEISCYKLGKAIGGPNGEPVIPEREIRIKSKPAVNDDRSIDLTSGLDLSTVVGKTSFSRMQDDLDSQGTSPNRSNGISSSKNNQVALRRRRSRSSFRGCVLL